MTTAEVLEPRKKYIPIHLRFTPGRGHKKERGLEKDFQIEGIAGEPV